MKDLHYQSDAKQQSRELIISRALSHLAEIRSLTLGGVTLPLETLLSEYKSYKGGVSCEYKPKNAKVAKKNAPSNVKIISGDIYEYQPKDKFNLVWLDTEHSGIDRFLLQIANFIKKMAFTEDAIFGLTLDGSMNRFMRPENSRFGNLVEDEKITQVKNFLCLHLANSHVRVEKTDYFMYKNDSKANPMLLMVFTLKKR